MRPAGWVIIGLLAGCGAEPEPTKAPAFVQSHAASGWVLRDASLYLPANLIDERVEARRLADYMKSLKAESIAFFAQRDRGTGVSGSIVFIIQPGRRVRIGVASGRPELPANIRTALVERLLTVEPPEVVGGPVMASLNFDVWGGGTLPANYPMALPGEWLRLIPAGGGRIDDAFVEKVWREG